MVWVSGQSLQLDADAAKIEGAAEVEEGGVCGRSYYGSSKRIVSCHLPEDPRFESDGVYRS